MASLKRLAIRGAMWTFGGYRLVLTCGYVWGNSCDCFEWSANLCCFWLWKLPRKANDNAARRLSYAVADGINGFDVGLSLCIGFRTTDR